MVSIKDIPTFTEASTTSILRNIASSDAKDFRIVFAPDRYIPVTDNDSPLHLSVDQIRTINVIQSNYTDTCKRMPATNEGASFVDVCPSLVVLSLNTPTHCTSAEQARGSFTRCKLMRLPNWINWQVSEFKQLDSMAKQEMYGEPCLPPKDVIILCQHWNYALKADGTRESRNCCDGSPRAAPQLKLANTYSSCIEQPCMRMYFSFCAHEGYVSLKADATNAYANSPPPEQPTFVYIDDQGCPTWWFPHFSGHGPSCPARSSRSSQIRRSLGEICEPGHRSPRIQVDYARAQHLSWRLQRSPYAHLPPGRRPRHRLY